MKSVLITGASKGFGLELLKVFLEKNWKVFPLVRNTESIEEFTTQYSDCCFPIKGDITDPSIKNSIEIILDEHAGSLDLLINNAGNVKKVIGFKNTSEEDLEDHFKVHCVGAFRIIKTCYPFLKKTLEPKIINVSSRKGSLIDTCSGKFNSRIIYPYQIAKCAQNMLTACLNQEFKKENIKLYSIHPGKLKTSQAAPDADTEPHHAASKLYNWINSEELFPVDNIYDIVDETLINW